MMFGYWKFHSKGEICLEKIPKNAHTKTSEYAGEEFTRAVAVPIRVATTRIAMVQLSAETIRPSLKPCWTRKELMLAMVATLTQPK